MKNKQGTPITYDHILVALVFIFICVVLYGAFRWYFLPINFCDEASERIELKYIGSQAGVFCDSEPLFESYTFQATTTTPILVSH